MEVALVEGEPSPYQYPGRLSAVVIASGSVLTAIPTSPGKFKLSTNRAQYFYEDE
jgi:hypothetical protein